MIRCSIFPQERSSGKFWTRLPLSLHLRLSPDHLNHRPRHPIRPNHIVHIVQSPVPSRVRQQQTNQFKVRLNRRVQQAPHLVEWIRCGYPLKGWKRSKRVARDLAAIREQAHPQCKRTLRRERIGRFACVVGADDERGMAVPTTGGSLVQPQPSPDKHAGHGSVGRLDGPGGGPAPLPPKFKSGGIAAPGDAELARVRAKQADLQAIADRQAADLRRRNDELVPLVCLHTKPLTSSNPK